MNEILLVLLAGAGITIVALVFRWQSFQLAAERRAAERADRQLVEWRRRDLEALRSELGDLARGQALQELDAWKAEFEQWVRRDAVRKSEGVTRGKVTEHFVPYLPDFEFNPKDARFLGSPVDFVVFDGLSEGDVRAVVFVEIKTGRSTLSTRERRIRDAIEAGQVEWLEIRPRFAAVDGEA
jgi:predicted Holliday junction resolvase-like endonuclease